MAGSRGSIILVIVLSAAGCGLLRVQVKGYKGPELGHSEVATITQLAQL